MRRARSTAEANPSGVCGPSSAGDESGAGKSGPAGTWGVDTVSSRALQSNHKFRRPGLPPPLTDVRTVGSGPSRATRGATHGAGAPAAQFGGTTSRDRPTAGPAEGLRRGRRSDRARAAGRVRVGHQHCQDAELADHSAHHRRQRARRQDARGRRHPDLDQARRGARQLRPDQDVHRHDPHRERADSRSTASTSTTSTRTAASTVARSFPTTSSTHRSAPRRSFRSARPFAQDDNVFAVVGTFIDFSGDAQTCIAKQQQRVLMTFNLTQAIIDQSPPGLIVTAGAHPRAHRRRSCSSCCKKEGTLKGKTVAVLGDTTETSVVKNTIEPELKKLGVQARNRPRSSTSAPRATPPPPRRSSTASSRSGSTEGVDTLFLSGDLASTKQFVQKVKQALPNLLLLADNNDVLDQAQQEQKSGPKPNPYDGRHRARAACRPRSTRPAQLEVLRQDLPGRDRQGPRERDADDQDHGRQDRRHLRHDQRRVPDDDDVPRHRPTGGPVPQQHELGEHRRTRSDRSTNRGSGPYSSLHTGKYSADDNWRLQVYDSTLGDDGLWKPITPLQNITGS